MQKEIIWVDTQKFSTSIATEAQAALFETEDTKKIMKEIAKLDLIVRFLRLGDVYNNSGNFGFTIRDEGKLFLNIMDFTVDESNKLFYGDFDNFIIGNGLFKTKNSDVFRNYVFKYRDLQLRLQDTLDILNSDLFKDIEGKLNLLENIKLFKKYLNKFVDSFLLKQLTVQVIQNL